MSCGNKFCGVRVFGSGNTDADLFFLGEAPGPEEVKAGKPFVGKAGRFLRKRLFRSAGIDEEQVYFANTVQCFPGRRNEQIKTPTAANIRNCRPLLVQEIKDVKPVVIVAMGNAALHACLELRSDDAEKRAAVVSGISQWRGECVWHREFGCWVVFTYHPSFLMRVSDRQYEYNQTVDDLEKAVARVISGPLSERARGNPQSLVVLNDADEAVSFFGRVRYTEVAVDTETTTLDFQQMQKENCLLGVSIACSETSEGVRAVYIPKKTLFAPSVRDAFQQMLSDPSIRKVWHNVSFDERVLSSVGFSFGEITGFQDGYSHVCSMLAAKLIDENRSVGLKALVWRYLSYGGYEKPLSVWRRTHKSDHFMDVSEKMRAEYAMMDVVATLTLWQSVFMPLLYEFHLWWLYEQVVCKVRRVFTTFERIGLQVDRKQHRKLSRACAKHRAGLEKLLYELAGMTFNLKSYPQLGGVLRDVLKVKGLGKTATDQVKTDFESLRDALKRKQSEKGRLFIQHLLDIRYIDKQVSTYIDKLDKVTWDDGRVHTVFNLAGTVTGRPTSSNPNIANISKDGLIRSLYMPREGCVFLECDMAAAELRVLARYSKDPIMLRAFRDGEDLHEETARAILGKRKNYKPTKQERDQGKRLNFGTVYGIGPGELAKKFEVSEDEASRFLDLYFRKYPAVAKWLEENTAFGKRHGYVKSLFGRRRRLPELRSDSFAAQARAVRQANNAVIQSCASDFCYLGIVRAFEKITQQGLRARLVHSVYDSVLVELPEEEVPLVKHLLTEAFTEPVTEKLDLMMAVDFTVSDRWGKGNPSRLAEVLLKVPWDERKN